MIEDSTINLWAQQQGDIHLRASPRKDTRPRDFRAAHGIILGTMIGANILIWGLVLARWTLGA